MQTDANWNVTALVDVSGNVVERYVYDPYGAVTVLTPSWMARGTSAYAMPYLWQGLLYDSAVGLYHADGRDISPTLRRPLQTDPLGLIPGNNDYEWEDDGPTDTLDPSGLRIYIVFPHDSDPEWKNFRLWIYVPEDQVDGRKYYMHEHFPGMIEARMTQLEANIACEFSGDPKSEMYIARMMNYINQSWAFPAIPGLGYFFPDIFGSQCVRWTNTVMNKYIDDKDIANIISLHQVTLRYPKAGGPEHSILLLRRRDCSEIWGIDNGSLGLDNHIFDPRQVIKDEKYPVEMRDDLLKELNEWEKMLGFPLGN